MSGLNRSTLIRTVFPEYTSVLLTVRLNRSPEERLMLEDMGNPLVEVVLDVDGVVVADGLVVV